MSSINGAKKILLGASQVQGKFDEFILATNPATPGMNVVPTSAARVHEVDTAAPGATGAVAAATDNAASPLHIVLERADIGETIDTVIPVADRVKTYTPLAGDMFLALAKSGQTMLKEGLVAFDSTGKLVTVTTGAIGRAVEATGGALASDKHIRVRRI